MRTRPRFVHVGFVAVAMLVCVTAFAGCTDKPPPPTPTRPPVAFTLVEETSVGDIELGGESEPTLVLRFTEAGNATIARGAGSFQVTLTDSAGLPDSLQFIGMPAVEGPGSLGAAATLNGRNVLTVNIVDSDPLNIEPMTISGIGIRASSTAALGAINAIVGGCAGSLAGCAGTNVLASPGTVVAP